jgi:hypothetical protein
MKHLRPQQSIRRVVMTLQLLLLLVAVRSSAFLPLASTVRRRVVPFQNMNHHDRRLLSSSWTTRKHSGGGSSTSTTTLGLMLIRPETLLIAMTAVTSTRTMQTTIPAQDMVATAAGAEVVAGLDPWTIVVVFLVGLTPFAVATVEFWRRIRLGQAFGTGSSSDSVVFFTNKDVSIGEDNAPLSSRGTQTLGPGAVMTAIVIFAVAALVIALAVVSVVTSDIPPPTSF